MEERLKVLLIDDAADEEWLLQDELVQAGYLPELRRVDTEVQMRAALADDDWDILLVDYHMPAFSALRALEIYHELKLDIPFIIVSGAIGEEAAVDMMRAGAHDYVPKSNRSRLLPVISREVREARLRREQAETANALRQSEQMLAAIAESAQDAIVMANEQGDIAYWNPAAERIFGYRSDDALGRNVELTLVPPRLQALYQRYIRRLQARETGSGQTVELVALHKEGHEIPVEISFSTTKVGGSYWVIGVLRDISERKRMERALRRMASHDALTGLFNRRLFEERVTGEIARARRYANPLSLFFIDIDHFKQVNDNYGHAIGDELLRRLAHCMVEEMRSVDITARYGGEEFVVLLPETGVHQAHELALRLCDSVGTHPFRLSSELKLTITISIGVAGYPQHALDTLPLIDAADRAMYLAKQQGRNRVCLAADKPDSTASQGGVEA